MVKKLREIGVDVEEETVRRTLKELEKFGILKFKETCIGRTKKEKKVYTLTVPPHMAKNMVEILLGLRSFLREITARVFSSVVVLVKDRKYSVMGLEGEQDFKKLFLILRYLCLQKLINLILLYLSSGNFRKSIDSRQSS